MAEQIWVCCLKNKVLKSPKSSIEIIHIFVEAYQDEMLSILKLDNLIVLNNHEDELYYLMQYCTVIDLSNISLDPDHDILKQISEICASLQTLILNNNRLSSKSLRLMFGIPTLPKNNLVNLKNLEISGNDKITLKGIEQYVLSIVPSLHQITFSWNDPKEADAVLFKKWKRVSKPTKNSFEITGLAKPLITEWFVSAKEKLKISEERLKTDDRVMATKFYGKNVTHDHVKKKICENVTLPELCYIRHEEPVLQFPIAKKLKVQNYECLDEEAILSLYN